MTEKEKLSQLENVNGSVNGTKKLQETTKGKLEKTFLVGNLVPKEDVPVEYYNWLWSILNQNKGHPMDIKFVYGETENDIIGVVLFDYSYYPGGGVGMEYGVKLFLKRGLNTDYKKIVYRDSYDANRDDRGKAYNEIESISIDGDCVTVNPCSNRRTDTYHFLLKKPDETIAEELLSLDEQKEFENHVETEIQRLLDENTNVLGKYPQSYDLTLRNSENVFCGSIMDIFYDEIPYDKAHEVERNVDKTHGDAYVVIKTQIDATFDTGKQYQWLKYHITSTDTICIDKQTARQSQIKDGKTVEMDAKK